MKNKYVGIVILNYNNYLDTVNCFHSVFEYNTSPAKFIIVDNGSTDDSAISLDNFFQKKINGLSYKKFVYEKDGLVDDLPEVSLLVSSSNDGYAQGNNKGLDYAYADDSIDKIMILNNDILFIEDILPDLINNLDTIPDCGIISPILLKKNLKSIDYNCARKNVTIGQLIKKNFLHYLYQAGFFKKEDDRYILKDSSSNLKLFRIELPSGSCMLMRKELLREIGSFDPNTFLYYAENILYSKLIAMGKHNYLLTSNRCVHLGASSTIKSPSLFIMKEGMKSENYYVKKYLGVSSSLYYIYFFSNIFFLLSFCLQKFLGIKIRK